MAIDYKQFNEKVEPCIKTDSYDRFLLTVKYEGKLKRKVIDYTKKVWDKKDRRKNIRKELEAFRDLVEQKATGDMTADTKLDVVAKFYFKHECTNSKWDNEKEVGYKRHIQPKIGNIAVGKITKHRVNLLKTDLLETKDSRVKEQDEAKTLSNRTVNKLIRQVLYPIMRYAEIEPPKYSKLKQAEKKKVKEPKEKWLQLLQEILTRYANDPYYRAMFLFALFGRRFNEIATLEKTDINFLDNTYTIRAENSKIGEDITFDLPPILTTALLELAPDKKLVFAAVRSGKKPYTPKKQVKKISDATGIEELTMHYFRHIYASVSVQSGLNIESVAASLGHTSSETTLKHYATIDNVKSSREINKLLINSKN